MSVSTVMACILATLVLKKLGSHCRNAVLGVSTSRKFTTMIVYNSTFVNTTLFDSLHVQKLKSLCNNVKKNVLFSDIVKRNIAPSCTNTSVRENKCFSCPNTCTSSVNRGNQCVNKYRGRILQQGGSESCIPIHENSSVKSVDNQGVFNVSGHTDTNRGNSIAQY